jgi:radical SAM superfamily enzyme
MSEETYERLHAQITDRGPWQHTSSGQAFFLSDPRPEEVDVRVIARAMSRQCRYNGHYAEHVNHYSVAQHCVLVARWMWRDMQNVKAIYAGLHHEDAEAYMGDIISQVKKLVPGIKMLEHNIEVATRKAMGVEWNDKVKSIVKEYDFIALATEVRDIMPPNLSKQTWGDLPEPRAERIVPWTAKAAEEEFLATHKFLLEKGGANV